MKQPSSCVEGEACKLIAVVSGLVPSSQYEISLGVFSGTEQVYCHDEFVCIQPSEPKLGIALEIPPLPAGSFTGVRVLKCIVCVFVTLSGM